MVVVVVVVVVVVAGVVVVVVVAAAAAAGGVVVVVVVAGDDDVVAVAAAGDHIAVPSDIDIWQDCYSEIFLGSPPKLKPSDSKQFRIGFESHSPDGMLMSIRFHWNGEDVRKAQRRSVVSHCPKLAGGFKDFLFSPLLGEVIQFD